MSWARLVSNTKSQNKFESGEQPKREVQQNVWQIQIPNYDKDLFIGSKGLQESNQLIEVTDIRIWRDIHRTERDNKTI